MDAQLAGARSKGDAAARRQLDARHQAPPHARALVAASYEAINTTRTRLTGKSGGLQCVPRGGATGVDSECCTQLITRRLDDEEEQDDGSSSGDAGVPDGLTPEEIVAFKKARRKEQCRVNQANYRKRKRAFEQQVDREIGALRTEIQELMGIRDNARGQTKVNPPQASRVPDPMNVVQDFYFQFRRAAAAAQNHRGGSPSPQQIDTIIGLQYERFSALDELFGVWQGYAAAFDVFELHLLSAHGSRIGDSVVINAQAELRSSMHSRALTQRLGLRDSPIVNCSVIQRFVFDRSSKELAMIVSEVDWIPALAEVTTSPRSQIRSAVELIRATLHVPSHWNRETA